MESDKDIKLSIEGHTDNVGKDDYNQTLSEQRANSVRAYLLSKGIDESRLIAQGFGETQPIADNKTAAGKAKNRRVVMKADY
jgi:outer membrane protein OmpA-like peptidoglycan-associated protein